MINKSMQNFVKNNFFNYLLTISVFANTFILALDGLVIEQADILDQINTFFTYIFIAEMGLKIISLGLRGKITYFI